MPDIEGDDGATRACYVRLLPLYTMETRRVQLCTQQKLRYLESARRCRTISRLRTGAVQSRDCVNPVRNLEIGTQFRDSETAQRNLEIAQIPRLQGTYTCVRQPHIVSFTLPLLLSISRIIAKAATKPQIRHADRMTDIA